MPITPYLGQIMPAAFGLIPKGWALCNGALYAVNTNQALFTLLGTTYGGDGIRTFALPDLRGRAILGSDLSSVRRGQVGGSETVPIQISQVPNHNHTIQATTLPGPARGGSPTNTIFAQTTTAPINLIFDLAGSMEIALSTGTNVTNAGGGQPHNNMQPSLVINYMIALTGIYPSRP